MPRNPPTEIWPSVAAIHYDSPQEAPQAPVATQTTIACAKCPPGTLHAQIVFEQGTSLCMDHRTMYTKAVPK